nr:MAG TPA: hypothetical protein [Caudoviricetes sp.]
MLGNPKAPLPALRERKRKKVGGWPRLKQKAEKSALRAAQNGQSAGGREPPPTTARRASRTDEGTV